ncbi:hypothetical protein [Nostoc sp.]|uniref:hypothetical protein n=1 Tax=Nostoc sp. TaxID=1180 RepID=UPI002FF93CF0
MNEPLEELRQKEELTDAEINELETLSPPGTFVKGPNFTSLGIVDVQRAFRNLQEGGVRCKHAMEQGCFIEVITLRVQHTELWLRMYWVIKNKKGKIFSSKDKRTFGQIIKECNALGLDPNLVTRLCDFNQARVDAVHKYILGETDYESLKEICILFQGLDKEVGDYVRGSLGLVV